MNEICDYVEYASEGEEEYASPHFGDTVPLLKKIAELEEQVAKLKQSLWATRRCDGCASLEQPLFGHLVCAACQRKRLGGD